MIFHEIYSVYYQTVAKILEVALDHPLKKDEICKIIEKYAFSESVLSIEPALREQKWQLIRSDGTDRKSVVEGKRGEIRGGRILKKKKKNGNK